LFRARRHIILIRRAPSSADKDARTAGPLAELHFEFTALQLGWAQPGWLASWLYPRPMCGRFARRSTQEVLADWFGVPLEEMPWFGPTFNAAPQSTQPVVRLNRDTGAREFALARWGLVPFWARDPKFGYATINARAEEVLSKPAFREAFRQRRCLVPADAFYEWEGGGSKRKRPYAIALRSGSPYALAGLWETWKPGRGESLETFTIITTDPNELVEPLHNRMPVILDPGNYARWLTPGDPAQPPVDLLRPYPSEKMRAWPVSDRVGNVRNDDPGLLLESQPEPEPPGLFG
jgi:putative SOS response-associated peptidase YedK